MSNMLTQSEYVKLDSIDLATGIRDKEFTCVEITATAIAQAEKLNPDINAIVADYFERALDESAAFDANPQLLSKSRLAGLPFLIKDLNNVAGMKTTFGSRLYEGYLANNNSSIVQRYIDAGLIIFGKTNTPERGLTITTEPVANGITRNPWNREYSTGGSSGGAGAAVAAGIIPAAHATDGGGSIRIPAACCGLFGLKPSRGLTAIENKLVDSWNGMSVGHVVSQTVRDSAAFLDIIKLDRANVFALPPSPDSFYDDLVDKNAGKLRIAVQLTQPLGRDIDDDCTEAVKKAAQLCESLGHQLEEVAHPVGYKPVILAMSRRINLYVYQSIAARLEELGLDLADCPIEASTQLMANLGRETTGEDYLQALDTVKHAERQMAEFHRDYDIIISPVLSKIPAKIGWLDMNSPDQRDYSKRFGSYSGFTSLYNGTGQPSMSMPLHRSTQGLPVGVMFTAAWGQDSTLLRLARQLEQAEPWPRSA